MGEKIAGANGGMTAEGGVSENVEGVEMVAGHHSDESRGKGEGVKGKTLLTLPPSRISRF
jgi:hypothetical protein